MNKEINHGFIAPVIEKSDFWLGSKKLGSVVLNEKGDWREFLPAMELQNRGFETNSCVSHAITSALELLIILKHKTERNFSDRWLAKISNTLPTSGNTPKAVADSVRKLGLVGEKVWPHEGVKTVEEFYKDIPQEIVDKGREFLKEFGYGYEWADKSNLKEALKRSPVCVAVSAWQTNDKGEYIRFGPSGHYVVLVAFDEFDRPVIFDSYDAGLKTLAKDFLLEFPQIYVLSRKKKEKVGFWQKIINWLKEIFK